MLARLYERRADELVTGLDARAWRRISAGADAHGPREYDWARVPIRIGWEARHKGFAEYVSSRPK